MSEQGQAGVALLGSTGSIGVNTLDVIARHPGRFRVFLAAGEGGPWNSSVKRR